MNGLFARTACEYSTARTNQTEDAGFRTHIQISYENMIWTFAKYQHNPDSRLQIGWDDSFPITL